MYGKHFFVNVYFMLFFRETGMKEILKIIIVTYKAVGSQKMTQMTKILMMKTAILMEVIRVLQEENDDDDDDDVDETADIDPPLVETEDQNPLTHQLHPICSLHPVFLLTKEA